MNIVHFSNNSLAGMPLRLVRSLDALTEHEVRLVDLERYDLVKQLGWYEYDLVFRESVDQVVALAESADIIHLHNFIDLQSDDFAPIDFAALMKKGVRVVRQFHSIPELVAERMGRTTEQVLDCPLPRLVVPHCAERYYETALVVPNFLPQDDPLYRPLEGEADHDVFFGPSKMHPAWSDRWAGKGAPEVVAMLERLAREVGCTFKWLHGRPLDEVLRAKRAARIVLDDMTSGSIHLSGLEGLSQGKVVLSYLDERMAEVLRFMSGTSWHPFINVRLEEAEDVLRYLLVHPEETEQMGREGRRWVEEHYSDRRLVRHFTQAYDMLMEDPLRLVRQEELAFTSTLGEFKAREMHDIVYRSRAKRHRS